MRYLTLTILCIACALNTTAQTRGTLEGEIYYPTTTYQDANGQIHKAIFRSTNHGAHLQLQYETLTEPLAGDMPIGQVVGDATPGVLYNYGSNELWVSFDYGVSWEYREETGLDGRYASGSVEGEIYKYNKYLENSYLYHSINYADVFDTINNTVYGYPEVGILSHVLYVLSGSVYPSFKLLLFKSIDSGFSFDTMVVDENIIGLYLQGNFAKISRGANPGELYLVTWHLPSNYHVYLSTDYGQSFTLQYQSDECDFYYWGYSFTAGRQPGSFYVFRNYLEHNGTHRELYIDYSSDYGQTFTTFHHVLDSTVSIAEPAQKFQVRTYPNPFKDQLTIELPKNIALTSDGSITIYNAQGQLVATKPVTGHTITWKPQNQPGGFYFIGVQSKNTTPDFHKVLFINH